jgi:hypothetical protein
MWNTIIIAMALLLTAGVANAAPIRLICDGTLTHTFVQSKEVRTVLIDLSAKTVTLENAGSAPISETGEDRISFSEKDPLRPPPHFGLRWGSVNRTSGAIYAHIDEADEFEGTCKPAQKLF